MNSLNPNISFHDFQPELQSFSESVIEGLSYPQKRIPPKFFYNERGSILFEKILEQPEYYIPEKERELLHQHSDEIAALIKPDAVLIEPGCGSCEKVQLLLKPLLPSAYVPMDISADFLMQSTVDMSRKFPWLNIYAACLDFTRELIMPEGVPQGQRVVFIPGSSLGNFNPQELRYFLNDIRRLVGKNGGLLVGIDRKKDPAILNAAYNDAAGVTAAFNLNLLDRFNKEIDGNFMLDFFEHDAFYNVNLGRIEMHLTSLVDQQVTILDKQFNFKEGETIHTENSYKYDQEEFIRLALKSGFTNLKKWSDEDGFFSIYFFKAM